MPRVSKFVSDDDEMIKDDFARFEKMFFEVYTDEEVHALRPKMPNLLDNQDFRWLLKQTSGDADHKRYRVNGLIQRMEDVLKILEEELRKRQIPYTAFDKSKVKVHN